jgi:hypothetical protein
LAGVLLTGCGSGDDGLNGTPDEATAGQEQATLPEADCEFASTVGLVGGKENPLFCEEPPAVEASRGEVTAKDRADARDVAEEIEQALHLKCRRNVRDPCFPAQSGSTPSEDVERIRQVLVDAGFADVVVRWRKPSDPGPPHSVVYAVPVGTGCVLGAVDAREVTAPWVLGMLPGGRCLA